MPYICCTQYTSKFPKLSSGLRTGKGQFSFQSQRKVMPNSVKTTIELCSLHMPECLALGELSHHRDYLGHEDLFLYSFSVYSCHLFLISYASVRSLPFLSFIMPIFAWNVPMVSLIFLKRSLVFLILLFSSISLHWSLRKAFLSLLAILWNSAFKWEYLSFSPLLFASLLFTAICKASSDSHFSFFICFSWGWYRSLFLVQGHEPSSIVRQALYQV